MYQVHHHHPKSSLEEEEEEPCFVSDMFYDNLFFFESCMKIAVALEES